VSTVKKVIEDVVDIADVRCPRGLLPLHSFFQPWVASLTFLVNPRSHSNSALSCFTRCLCGCCRTVSKRAFVTNHGLAASPTFQRSSTSNLLRTLYVAFHAFLAVLAVDIIRVDMRLCVCVILHVVLLVPALRACVRARARTCARVCACVCCNCSCTHAPRATVMIQSHISWLSCADGRVRI